LDTSQKWRGIVLRGEAVEGDILSRYFMSFDDIH